MGKPEQYLLFQRGKRKKNQKSTNRLVYYVQYRNYEGKQIIPVSTGETTKTAAHAWAHLNRDRIIQKSYERTGDPLKELLTEFYKTDSKILKRRADRGESIGEIHRKHCEGYCKNYFIPFFTKNGIRSAHDITRSMLRELQDYIRDKKFTAKTVNSAISALRRIFDYLVEEEKLKINPCQGLKHLVELGEKDERGTFPFEKVKDVFKLTWDDNKYLLLSMLGAGCGLRNSEINALRASSLTIKNGYHYLDVKNAYNSDTKTKTLAGVRSIPIHPVVAEKIKEHIKILSLGESDYLFWEQPRGKGALTELPPKDFGESVVYAAKKMGFDEKYLNDHNITFYGWRHFYNSLLIRANINPYRVKVVMGHSLDTKNDMTANYFKQIADDSVQIIDAIRPLFE